jgi:glycosyltransferase involved in cell wall biosynthesis
MYILYLYPEVTIKGGADKVIVEKANYFVAHGYQVTVVTESQMGRELSFPLDGKVQHIDMGIDFNRQYAYHGLQRLLTYLVMLRKYKKHLKAILMEERPDIVITAMGRSIDFVTSIHDGSVKIGEAHSVKANVRSLNLMERKGVLHRLMARLIRWHVYRKVSHLDAMVLLTRQDADSWTEARQTFVIPNAIPQFPERYSSLDNKQILMVARYNDAKGYNYMVEAWETVHRRHPDWTLNVYGSGELHDDVIRWIQQRHLSTSMVLHEPIDNIMEQYLDSSIYVMSSRYEAFPMVLLEAMVCGVPCVSFDCPHGPRNIIRDGEDGLLVEYLNPQALADGICRLIEDEALRKQLGAKARENIQRFSLESVMKQWTELFDTLTSQHRS